LYWKTLVLIRKNLIQTLLKIIIKRPKPPQTLQMHFQKPINIHKNIKMKNTLIILSILITGFAMGPKKKPTKVPSPFVSPKIVVIKKKALEVKESPITKCFSYKTEVQKDSLLYVTQSLLEYGWAGDNARMVIITYNYDPVKKAEAKKKGDIYSVPESM